MALLRVIEWTDQDDSTIVQKFNIADNTINCGSVLNVRESQVAIFCDKGRLADVFMPGYYKLNTDSIPILTRLMSWQYGFEKPFKSDIYFVSTKRFSNQKWGTASPIIIRDKDYGAVRVRGYGTYAFRVKDPVAFMRELFGTLRVFSTRNISDYIRSMLVMGVADVIGESGVPVLDIAGNLMELSTAVNERLFTRFAELGLELCGFNIESFSLPPELEKALDESARLGILRKNIDIYTRIAQADALRDAAKNQGAAGGVIGAGLGMGMGMSMGQMFSGGNGAGAQQNVPPSSKQEGRHCTACGALLAPNAKFCSECGSTVRREDVCPKCGVKLAPGTKFCPECGTKVK